MRTGAHGEHVAELVRRRRQVAYLHAALDEAVGVLSQHSVYLEDEASLEVLNRLRGVVDETRKWVE